MIEDLSDPRRSEPSFVLGDLLFAGNDVPHARPTGENLAVFVLFDDDIPDATAGRYTAFPFHSKTTSTQKAFAPPPVPKS